MLNRPSRASLAPAMLMLALLATSALAGCTMWSEPKHASWKNATGLEQHERLFWQALKDKDWLNVESHMASNFKLVTADKIYTKDEAVALYKGMTLVDFSIGDFDITQSGDTWVVNYTATYSFDAQGKRSQLEKVREMSIWQKQKSGWVGIAHADLGKAS